MSHSLIQILVHVVWTTKDRHRFLGSIHRHRVMNHLLENATAKGIVVRAGNVQPEHVHLLLELQPGQCIDDVVRLLKGESSHWINHEGLVGGRFSWQTGYGAFSVGAGEVPRVRAYIDGQDEHHQRTTFTDEYPTLAAEGFPVAHS